MKAEYRLALLALTLTLAACGSGKQPAAAGTAGGEVLPGSASDAMLPVDTVRSQPPLAPGSDADDAGKNDSGSKSGGKQADKPKSTNGPPEPTAAPTPPAEAPAEPKPAAE